MKAEAHSVEESRFLKAIMFGGFGVRVEISKGEGNKNILEREIILNVPVEVTAVELRPRKKLHPQTSNRANLLAGGCSGRGVTQGTWTCHTSPLRWCRPGMYPLQLWSLDFLSSYAEVRVERRQELALEDPLLETVHPSALKVF